MLESLANLTSFLDFLSLLLLQASLSAEQKSEVSSIVGMGFPSPRVARAMLRCKDDKTKVRQMRAREIAAKMEFSIVS